jgi:hypothetical protein
MPIATGFRGFPLAGEGQRTRNAARALSVTAISRRDFPTK